MSAKLCVNHWMIYMNQQGNPGTVWRPPLCIFGSIGWIFCWSSWKKTPPSPGVWRLQRRWDDMDFFSDLLPAWAVQFTTSVMKPMNPSLVEFVTTSVVALSVWHSESFISVWTHTDLVKTLTGPSVLDVLSTAFTGVVVFLILGTIRTTSSYDSFSWVFTCWIRADLLISGHPLNAELWSPPQLAQNISSRVKLP